MDSLRVVGFDPSLRNWGIACGTYNPVSGKLIISHLDVIQPAIATGKAVRQNSKDLEAAWQLYQQAMKIGLQAQAVFVEVPVGSQSARAMASYGICVGVLGSIRAANVPFFEVTPLEVKVATVGKKTASKAEMIGWATSQFPSARWPYYEKKGESLISEAKAEHMADAIGAIVAGIGTPPFRQFLPFLQQTTRSTHADPDRAG